MRSLAVFRDPLASKPSREQYLADKDADREWDKQYQNDMRIRRRPGYANLMKLKGQLSEERNNGM